MLPPDPTRRRLQQSYDFEAATRLKPNECVVPLFDGHGIPPNWILTDRDTGYLRDAGREIFVGHLALQSTRCGVKSQAGHPQQKGSRSSPAFYTYNIKALRDREMLIATHAAQSCQQFVSQ
ncbi:hypothetical protein EAS61_18460 [Bradyrhizobium zhanjiangense]|uniref:Uncharacterized protein n=1 Tax=Bradyrhizobium zhanjiangense TaxID=1325107 RepID=A0A4Q0QL02_9BRAD|nr:hypothetical protein EAS61_18460 [Bradyrhizobium zhanjiangense]